MLATQDQNGFNAGMFILRVHSWSVTALAEVVALRTLQPSVHLDFYDQSAIKWVIERPGYEEHTVYQPHNWWNAFGLQGKPVPSDRWILHFAGVDCCGQEDSKATVMGRWLDILDEGKGGYVVPIEETTLPQEVEQYWDILRTAMKVLQQADAVKDSSSEVQAARNELRSTILRKADDLKLMEDTLLKMKDTMSKATQTRGN